jgi:hypothetical protein
MKTLWGGFVPGAGQTYDAGMNYGPSASEAAGFNPAGGGSGGGVLEVRMTKAGRRQAASTATILLALKDRFKFRNLTKTSLIEQILECNL